MQHPWLLCGDSNADAALPPIAPRARHSRRRSVASGGDSNADVSLLFAPPLATLPRLSWRLCGAEDVASDSDSDVDSPTRWPQRPDAEVVAAYAALLVYDDRERILRALTRARDVRTHAVENAFAVSWVDHKRLVVAFRGTQLSDWMDLFDDADLRHTPLYWADSFTAHAGFARHFAKIQASVAAALVAAAGRGVNDVLLAGHSLGGAVAHLAAYYFSSFLPAAGIRARLALRTFGAPRVGTEAFRGWCAAAASVAAVAYESSEDPVPMVPAENCVNWASKRVIFVSSASPLKAHSMRRYARDVIALSEHEQPTKRIEPPGASTDAPPTTQALRELG